MRFKHVLHNKFMQWGFATTAVVLFGSTSHAVFVADSQPIASVGAISLSTYNLTAGTALAFRGDYVRSTWDGDLVAFSVSSSGNTSIKWRAKDQMPAYLSRRIATSNGTTGHPFNWTSLSTEQQTALGDQTVLNYLRGDASKELSVDNVTGVYRQRYSKLGAVIHGRPYYREQGKSTRVYVGANDGMLHSFDANTGVEAFAYVPSMVFNKLRDLSLPSPSSFNYYVDGQIAIRDVTMSNGKTGPLLVSGLGSGAKGLFALDVSNASPANDAAVANMLKWEITNATNGYGNLGNVYTTPQIVKLKNGTMAVLVPNGPNSTKGVSSLFVINANTGALLAEVYADQTEGIGNGLGGIATVDMNGSGSIDTVYAGDLKGNLWKFDFSNKNLPSKGTKLFTPESGTERPITVTPSVVMHPLGGVMVNFGTGKVYDSSDLTSVADEYIYGIWDNSQAKTRLATPTLSEVSATANGVTTKYRVGSASDVNYAAGDRGWRVNLSGGERLLDGETQTNSGRYVVTTSVPNEGSTQGAWLLQLTALTGSQPSAPIFDVNGDDIITKTGTSDKVMANGGFESPVGRFMGTGVWSQPVMATIGLAVDVPYFNSNLNTIFTQTSTTIETTTTTTTTPDIPAIPPVIVPTVGGVSNGHFDFDIYYTTCNPAAATYSGSCSQNKHTHEYDDIFNVVGVNMLNASDPAFNLSNAVSGSGTLFKILVANTRYSPAVKLTVTKTDGSVVVDKAVWALPLSPEGFLAATPGGTALTFSRSSLKTLSISMPIDAFSNKEWIGGSGDTRAGLIPSETSCVRANKGAQGTATGAWMNGALTIQIVKASAKSSEVQAAIPSDAGGFRLKSDSTSQSNQLVQYTTFWHHSRKSCLGDSDWNKVAAPDTDNMTPKVQAKATGSDDPIGAFYLASNGSVATGTPTGGSPAIPGTTTTTTNTETYLTYAGQKATESLTWTDDCVTKVIKSTNGTLLNTSTSTWGKEREAPPQLTTGPKLGRIAWRELVR